MDQMVGILKETAIFMVAAQMLLHFFPGKKFEKYGRMIVALIVLSQLTVPILGLSGQEVEVSFLEKIDDLEAENEMFSQRLEGMEAGQEQMAQSGLLLSVEERIEKEAAAAGVRVEGVHSDGQMVTIEVRSAAVKREDAGVEPVKVEKIQLDEQARHVDAGASRGRKREDLVSAFAKELGMEEEDLEVIELE